MCLDVSRVAGMHRATLMCKVWKLLVGGRRTHVYLFDGKDVSMTSVQCKLWKLVNWGESYEIHFLCFVLGSIR